MAHLKGLNDAQLHAVTTEANVVQVLAPPGSGKTKTLTSRVAHLLSHRNYRPWNVICLTFTIKSSREMKERLRKLIGDQVASKVILGTFHSVCRRYLATYGHLIGIQRGFGIADSSDSSSIIKRIIKDRRLDIEPKLARNKISNCKSRNIGPVELQLELSGKNRPKDITEKQELIVVYEEYQQYLQTSNLLDYDDLLLRCLELVKTLPSCVSNVQAVLIDEFQDTNHVQFDLMRYFAQRCNCVTTVGDPDQSIYGWRSAEVTNLTKMYVLWPDTSIINLEENYRSTASILEASQMVIEQDTARPQKSLAPTHRSGTRPVLRHLPTADIEAEYIVTEIRRSMTLSVDLFDYSDYAILLRFSPLSRKIESALGKAGIPYRMVGGKRFFDRVEVKLIVDYLHVIAHPDNSDALSRIINVPGRGIGEETIKGLIQEATDRKCTLWAIIQDFVQGTKKVVTKLNTTQKRGLAALANLITAARNKLENEEDECNPKILIELICKKTDLATYLEHKYQEDHETRWDNILQLMAQADEVNQTDKASADEEALPEIENVQQQSLPKGFERLVKFLANVALSTETQSEQAQDGSGEAPKCVTISTMHAAKGLEWPVVFVPACYTGSIPHSRAEDMDEERRLLYVAMTRAQAMLYLSVPKRGQGGGENELSSFLQVGKIQTKFSDAAPLLDFAVIEDLAAILRRKAPSRSKISKAISSCPNILDDRWPTDGSFDAEEMAKQWTNTGNGYGYKTAQGGFKRRKVSGEALQDDSAVESTVYHRTTMQSTQSFTIPTESVGFTTASHQMRVQLEAERLESSKTENVGRKPGKDGNRPRTSPKHSPKNSPKKPKSKSVQRAVGQTSLKSWLSSNKMETTSSIPAREIETIVKTADSQPRASSTASKEAPLKLGHPDRPIVIEETEVGLPPYEPLKPEPVQNSTETPTLHRVLSVSSKPLRRPVFHNNDNQATSQGLILLSSSPPPEEKSRVVVREEIIDSTTAKARAVDAVATSAFKPASTLHRTTLGRFTHGGISGGTFGGQGQPQRRRLGMGGPIKPWKP